MEKITFRCCKYLNHNKKEEGIVLPKSIICQYSDTKKPIL